jgi:predicted Rossmann-fold nucleotide-binding protein
MDEFFEIVTSTSLGVIAKPILVVNTDGYFDTLGRLMSHIVREGFARPQILDLYKFVDTPEEAIDAIADELGFQTRG